MNHKIAIAGSSGVGKTSSMIDLICVELITGHNEVIIQFNEYSAHDLVRKIKYRLEQLNIPYPVTFKSTSFPEKKYTRMTIEHQNVNGQYYSLFIDTPCTPPSLTTKPPKTDLDHLMDGAQKVYTTLQLHRNGEGAVFAA